MATESIAGAAKRFDVVVDRATVQSQQSMAISKEAKEFQKSILKAIKREYK